MKRTSRCHKVRSLNSRYKLGYVSKCIRGAVWIAVNDNIFALYRVRCVVAYAWICMRVYVCLHVCASARENCVLRECEIRHDAREANY